MTRTYARETVTFTQAEIDSLVADGRAQYFPGLPGYVVDRKQAVRMHQIVAPVVEDDNAAEAWLAEQELAESSIQDYIRLADEQGISVEEYTDGEYYVNNGRVFSAEERDRYSAKSRVFQKFDDILADFGI
ncbi:hypothetical protein KHO57_gp058 [Mycobacterium phage Phabba]|uniref:Uncharacterized protein n=1 Tax=Mycobacterium phage Phabba TaxID=2027899 RepID=A0A249XSB6_9CAUD|nr:hypothetical protein KHO57_gp058 [Mycobacterium phage Phabba]ASZ74633.1 hypothetical protein SEA_PHABBA_58 [Mycobacterium phage Phabba]